MQVRRSKIKDLETIAQIEATCFSDAWSSQSIESMLSMKTTCCMVAEEDGRVVGYSLLLVALDQMELLKIAVLPLFRGRGIAAALMEAMLIYAEGKKMTAITLEVRTKNEPAVSLYRRYGFYEAGIRKNYYKNPPDHALIMWLEFPLQ